MSDRLTIPTSAPPQPSVSHIVQVAASMAAAAADGGFKTGRPEQVDGRDGRVDEQLDQERRREAADHRRGHALHHVGAGAGGPHDRHLAHLGRTRLTAPWRIASTSSSREPSSFTGGPPRWQAPGRAARGRGLRGERARVAGRPSLASGRASRPSAA
jgi:hypothetical protein